MTLAKPNARLSTLELRKFSYRDLLDMERAGILGEDERIELLHGSIVAMTPVNPPHAWAVDELHERFTQALGAAVRVRSQNPLRLSEDLDDSELPLPDVMVMRRRAYTDHPLPENVYFLVEVSDTSLVKDRQVKLPLYAHAGIPELWIVNLVDRQIEVYTEPHGKDYLTRHTHALTSSFAPQRFPSKAQPWLSEEILNLLG
ncbi:MAG: Uma2 family endonuclease [Deinococcota bacterium]|jgi:Uma2 family endonuclease|nr:Uma2 family endonuclease [Deinococcota bacterium]